MKMMHALDIDDKTAAMFRIDLNVSISKATGNAILVRDDTRSIYMTSVSAATRLFDE
jgi:hypothetical protein